jgi:hypothetical protein
MSENDNIYDPQWDGTIQGMIPIGSPSVYIGDKVRLQTRITTSMVPTGLSLHVFKIERAPDGTKVVWLTSTPPENA